MNKNPNQPREFDAVKGGEAPPPLEGVVLVGLVGVKGYFSPLYKIGNLKNLIPKLASPIQLVGKTKL